ncbi:MAG TPA: sulfatase-like hydrolase/transferase, partial [bacterium]|nr:sulfatase-like hydrolase/transferase [bacterium]
AVNLISASIYGKKTTFKENLQLYGMAILFLVVLYDSASSLLFYWTFNNIFSLIKNVIYNRIYDKGIIRSAKTIAKKDTFAFDRIFISALISFLLLTFTAAPLSVLSSGSKSDFEEPLFHYMGYSLFFSGILFLLAIILYFNVPYKIKILLSFTTTAAVVLGLLNMFIFTGSYGDMSHFIFSEGIEIDDIDIYLNVISGIVILTALLFLFYRKNFHFIRSFLTVISGSLILFCFYEAACFYNTENSKTESKPGEYSFTFSKTGRNVVIIMLDRFIGGFVPQLLELIPEIKENYDGFVYYSNTLSPASYTIGGVPAIMGGWEYTVRNVNTTRTDVPLIKKLDESARIMPYNFDKAGFDVTIFSNDIYGWFKNDSRENIGDSLFIHPDFPKFRDQWLERYSKESRKDDYSIRKKLLVFGIFRSAPLFIREFIYDSGEWHVEEEPENSIEEKDEKNYIYFHQKSRHRRDTTLKYYAALDFLPEMSSVSDDPKNKFIYMTNDLTHEPHLIDKNFKFEITGKIGYPRDLYKKFNKNMNSLKHLYTDGAALKLVNEWLNWMKDNGVYDNTRIIIVSDHGRAMYDPYFKSQKIPKARKRGHPVDFDNLLMVKDFNSRGNLLINKTFMSSADVPSIAMERIIEGTNPYTGKKIESPFSRFPFYAYDIQWRLEKQEKFRYKIHEGYVIEENDFDNCVI